jgi:hypothetical protein
MDKEPKKLVSSRKIGKRLVRGTFAGRIVTASIPSSRLRSLKSQEDGYNADESDFEESQEESTIFYVPSLYMKRQSQSIKSLPKNLQKNRIVYVPGLQTNRNSGSGDPWSNFSTDSNPISTDDVELKTRNVYVPDLQMNRQSQSKLRIRKSLAKAFTKFKSYFNR